MIETILSVIVPVYRVEAYLDTCIQSVITQNEFVNGLAELILVDDGSPDNCGAICDRYAKEHAHITVVHKENGGLSDARNCGIRAARGRYVQFLDSDDYLVPNALQRILSLLEQQPDVLIFRHTEIDAVTGAKQDCTDTLDTETVARLSGEALLEYVVTGRQYDWYATRNVVNKQFLTENELYFENGRVFEDALWTPQLYYHARTARYLNEPLYAYLVNRQGSIVRGVSQKNYEDKLFVLESTEQFCRSHAFSPALTAKLFGNVSQIYVSLLADWFLLDKAVRRALWHKLKPYDMCLQQAARRYKRWLYFLSKIVGLRPVAYLLYLRAQYVRKKFNSR